MSKRIGIATSHFVFIIVMAVGTAFAAVPQNINYQGNLTDSGGAAINGAVSMVFSIYDVASGGTALWSETQPTVQVTQGLYSVSLGAVAPITLPFDAQYYLGVKVGTDAEMTPRQALTSVGYAFMAETANSASTVTGSLSGDVTGTLGATVVSQVGGQTGANVAAGAVLANNATDANTFSRIVRRDSSGNFSAGTITANLTGNVTGNATTATTAGSVTNGVYTSGSYADPAWITSLAGSKISGDVASATIAATVTNGVYTNSANTFTTQAPISINPFNTAAGNTGEIRFKELAANGSEYIAFKAPDSISLNKTFTLPSADGTTGQVLKTDGSGNLGWVSAASGTVTSVATGAGLSGGPITGSGTISLADTTVSAGAYTRANITVDAQGRLTAAANGAAVDLGTADVTGSLPDSKLATISTAGRVANSATTATSANTASAIIARDGSGNFSAGTISATAFSGSGASLTNLNASSLSSGTVPAAQLPAMVGDSGSGGTKGAVPAPASGDAAAGKYLKADGTWTAPGGGGVSGLSTVVHGCVTGTTGAVQSGSGFNSSRTGTGLYSITFSTAFSITPTVVITTQTEDAFYTPEAVSWQNRTVGGFQVVTTDLQYFAVDLNFCFMAMN